MGLCVCYKVRGITHTRIQVYKLNSSARHELAYAHTHNGFYTHTIIYNIHVHVHIHMYRNGTVGTQPSLSHQVIFGSFDQVLTLHEQTVYLGNAVGT